MKTVYALMGLMIASAALAQTPAGSATSATSTDQRFQNRDTNKDGFLSKQEVSGTRIADNFDTLDTNKDGKLSAAEVTAGRTAMRNQRDGDKSSRGERAATRFKELDADKNGLLTATEFTSPMTRRFDALDTNKDHNLTLEELQAGRGNNTNQKR